MTLDLTRATCIGQGAFARVYKRTFCHPNLAAFHELIRDAQGRPMIIMEYIDGISLETAAARGPLSAPVIRKILTDVLSALGYVHDRNVLHRDIKPSNVLISRTGEVKLIDFGVARDMSAKRSQTIFAGTAAFASPEALEGCKLLPSADLFSAAALAYWMLTGQPPFGDLDRRQVVYRIATWHVAPLPADTPEDLCQLIDRALRYRPESRAFRSAEHMREHLLAAGQLMAGAEELAALAGSVPGEDVPLADIELAPGRPRPKSRTRRLAGGLLAAGLLGGMLWATRGEPAPSEHAGQGEKAEPQAIIPSTEGDRALAGPSALDRIRPLVHVHTGALAKEEVSPDVHEQDVAELLSGTAVSEQSWPLREQEWTF